MSSVVSVILIVLPKIRFKIPLLDFLRFSYQQTKLFENGHGALGIGHWRFVC
ncbi:hypothetical protein FDUTEX481_08609 [Tolypothrix sp. PCC 7601]|nr:hypothetical protein FDUTEX481_08609 [Tolypothrix sp. PCC 7601]